MNNLQRSKVAIIGAGMAGLACAERLHQAGYHPVIFDKSSRIGGRVATHEASDGWSFDHGAQFLTARSQEFKDRLDLLVTDGAVRVWQPIDAPTKMSTKTQANDVWYVGAPAMDSLFKPMASGLDLRLSEGVTSLKRENEAWRLKTERDQVGTVFERVICTVPAPQVREIIPMTPDLINALSNVASAPCWTVMLGFNAKPDFGFDVWRSDTADITWISRNSSKPGRVMDDHCWVVHASPDWSQRHLGLDNDDAAERIMENLRRQVSFDPSSVAYLSAHLWRYARTIQELGTPYISSIDGSLYLGGDWCLGPRIECAFESGIAIARALLDADS